MDIRQKNVLDYWSKWHAGRLEVWPSIDELGERAEIIRSGTVWTKIDENLKELVKLQNIIVRPGITVGAWNVARLPEIIEYFVDIGIINGRNYYNNFFINLLEWPQHYHVQILPDEYKKSTIKKLTTFIESYNKKYNTNIDFIFTHILHELKTPHSPELARKFIFVTNEVDEVRNEKLIDVIPEMKIIYDMYGN